MRSGARRSRFQMKGPPMQKPSTMNSEMPKRSMSPRAVDCEWAGGLAAIGVAQIRRDNAVLALELLHRVEGVVREARDRGVQPAAGDDQQREAGADLLIVDADVTLFVERHDSLSLHSVVFRVRSRIAQTREHLESSSRHGN